MHAAQRAQQIRDRRRSRKGFWGVVVGVILVGFVAGLVAACGSSGGGSAVTYAPAAYGETVGGQFRCYYVNDNENDGQAQVNAMIAAGNCPARAVAYPMPLAWEEEYDAYYTSPAYYNTYIPVTYRTHYTSVYVVNFNKTYSTQITKLSSSARYRSSTGTITTGTSKLKFSSGNGTTAGHGGGSGRSGCSESMTMVHLKSGTSGSSSSGRGGGSGRSGSGSGTSSGSRSGTITHSGSGC